MSRDEKFLEIFSAYSSPLFYYVLKLTENEDTAKDIVQECFIRVWENIEKIDTASPVLPLLITYIKNLLRDEYRKNKNYKHLLAQVGEEMKDTASRPAAEDLLALKDREKQLDISLKQLSEKRKHIFSMVRLQGLSHKEVAASMNVSVADVKKQMRLSLQHLRKVMNMLFFTMF
ncbi:MAG: sigma-70 family RNA polymerase sigma factor [Chitinophagaceae bacterium]|nr:sigma-70 family RNA polymerase sigma factor [Chitinophagaceae bacterium]